ncbi:hypothetical protein BKI52_06990 [marine bacterium AO1-C]|nr:hypothetical protein BKI52_06990 [marine bacterium AO1-C]
MWQKALIILTLTLLAPGVMSQAAHEFAVTDLPDSLKSKAEIVVLTKYQSYRGPCIPVRMKGGKRGRRWSRYYAFGVQQRLKGTVTPPNFRINTYSLPKNHSLMVSKVESQQHYWVFINPNEQTRKVFSERYPRRHAVTQAEIVAILPAKTE